MSPIVNDPMRLFVRCLAEQKAGYWQAFSLEFGLAAQGESFEDVRQKLDYMIRDYLVDALVGEDRQHAEVFLARRATLSVYVRYYRARVLHALRMQLQSIKTLREPMPLAPPLGARC